MSEQPSVSKQPSLFCATVLALVAPLSAWASTPASTTMDPASPPFTYTTDTFTISNATPIPLGLDQGPHCNNPAVPCDMFQLTVNVPAGYNAAHPNAAFKVTEAWTDPTGGASKAEYDLYVYHDLLTSLDGSVPPQAQEAALQNPGIVTAAVPDGTSTWTIIVVPWLNSALPPQANMKIEFLSGQPGPAGEFGVVDPTVPGAPRYQNFYAPEGTSAQSGNGEFNIGFDPKTKRIMTMNNGPVWRLTPPEVTSSTQPSARPESCEALWEDVSSGVTDTGLDPILWTDQKSGRTLAINATVGASGGMYSDDDGDSWLAIAGGPDGGADHETFGTGPLPAALAGALTTPVNQGQYALYCSQDVVGPGACQRSLTLGASWENGVAVYTGNPNTCGGLHGHVHIASDGTAWLPVKDCADGHSGGVISTDAGTTWSEFDVKRSGAAVPEFGFHQQLGADPSIALDADSKAYYCYVNNEPVAPDFAPEGHVHVAVSTDHGATWTNDTDVGIVRGIVNAVHPEAVGGSSGRAACGFLGTNEVGDYQAYDFKGNWYAFIATTYDGGLSWTTVNASPNDPVQRHSGVWQQGGGQGQRNLLDFNEITVDDKGFPLYGYSDGCTSDSCISGAAGNDFTAWMRVARQSGGKSLFAANDPVEPATPKAACLTGTRDDTASHLSWKAPDNGGANIAKYTIWRSDSAGNETLIAQTTTPATQYDDLTVDPSIPDYFYEVKAINSQGESIFSNELDLHVTVAPALGNVCQVPGYIELTDPAADDTGGPGTDLLYFRLAQPYVEDGVLKLAFDIETDPGQAVQPVGSSWYVAMKILDAPPATTFHYRAVHMTWNSASPTFESYTPSANNSGGVDGRFVTAGSEIPADPGSNYAAPYTHVSIVVKASDLGLKIGDSIAGFVSAVSQTTGGIATALLDQMPDSLSYTTPYQVRYNGLCAPDLILTDGFGSDQAR